MKRYRFRNQLRRSKVQHWFFDKLLTQARRREWTANLADPTLVTKYELRWHGQGDRVRVSLTLVSSWVTELRVHVGLDPVPITQKYWGKSWTTMDNVVGDWLFAGLEDAHDRLRDGLDDDEGPWHFEENPREKGDDDGVEYGDPRDERDERDRE
jgi:hypothetical protein